MTEAKWQSCADPDEMLAFLSGRTSDRKLRLFAVACCRRIWHALTDERSRTAVQVIESCIDGLGTTEELDEALAAAEAVERTATGVARAAARAVSIAWSTAEHTRSAAAQAAADPESEQVCQADLLRDIIGNPFQEEESQLSWLQWNDACVPRIAQTIYAENRFVDLPVLADALEDAGCTDPAILNHCRSGAEHVRGCWVVDLLLGKK